MGGLIFMIAIEENENYPEKPSCLKAVFPGDKND